MSLLREGETVGQTYSVERLLGEGAFAEVYRVRHRFLGRQAMKVFKLVGMTIEELDQSLSEARLLSRIGHPNIVRVYEANVADVQAGRIAYFTMELAPGGTLWTFRRSLGDGFVPVSIAVEIICQVCRALSVAHRAKPPVVHRDVKPQNILVSYEGDSLRVCLSDFGLAKHVNPLTLQASARGTRSFTPPESFSGKLEQNCSADVWAAGLCLYWLLTDSYPYIREDDPPDSVSAFPTRTWVDPSLLNIRVDKRLDDITRRSLALRPQDRYQDACAFLAGLEVLREKYDPSNRLIKDESANPETVNHDDHPAMDRARRMAHDATALSRDCTRLREAADLLDEALRIAPALRDRYEYRLQLWRKGITQ